MVCHKCVACVDISPAPCSLGSVSQAVTHAPRNGEGEKLAQETILLETNSPPTPKSIEVHEGFYSEFGVRCAQNTPFSFPWGLFWCSICKGCFLREDLCLPGGGPVPVSGSPKPIPSRRPQQLAFYLMEGESLRKKASMQLFRSCED